MTQSKTPIDFVHHVKTLLELGKEYIRNHPARIKYIGNTNTKGESSIQIDTDIETLFINYIKQQDLSADIFSEEIGSLSYHKNPHYIISFDPLDGSTNYSVGKERMPYGMLIAVYKSNHLRLSDIVAAGAYEMTQSLGYLFDGKQTKDFDGNRIRIKQDWEIHLSTPFYVDLHRRSYYDTYQPIAEKLYIRNTGSTIGNLVFVLENSACGIGHPRIKAEEIGAVYGLIKGAGGIVVDHEGRDLGDALFNCTQKYQLLGGCKKTTEYTQDQINS